MKDWSQDGSGVNVTAKFHLAFTNSREKLFRIIQNRHVMNLNPPQHFFALKYAVRQDSILTGPPTIVQPVKSIQQSSDSRRAAFL